MEVDTWSIRIKPLKQGEAVAKFLEDTQAYVCKEGNGRVFGERIEHEASVSLKRKRDDEVYREIVDEEDEEKARKLLREKFPKQYIYNFVNCREFLRSKARKVTLAHVPNFDAHTWVVPPEIVQWRKEMFSPGRQGRPVSLILVGPPRCGKTEWALSFGRPAQMTNRWCMDALTDDCTHLVLNDINAKEFPLWREFLGGQMEFVAGGKYRPDKVMPWGKPTIWTCNYDNDPRKYAPLREYLEHSPVVVVKVTDKLFR
ncbi:hypothetical protein CSOJ01_16095 [Colletotrichum sojae]|uniref:Geminivirus AL1 replication-associated protein central domain-containing protein n=1 Tax=Colletotrichum sojae TaxID=2175907 RepID=A0A8H6ILE1_9PEZI|nr:hypothetical protein CSOJ01_16095 [Colletotrichum sojae]